MAKNKKYTPVKYTKAINAGGTVGKVKKTATKNSKNSFKSLFLIFALFLFIVGSISVVLVSQKQQLEPQPIAPNVPQSQPEAYIPPGESCVTNFSVGSNLACAESGCYSDSDCQEGFVCIPALPGEELTGICGLASLIDECQNERNYDACCTEPSITVTPPTTPTETPEPTPTGTPKPTPTDEPTPTETPEPTPTGTPEPTPTDEPLLTDEPTQPPEEPTQPPDEPTQYQDEPTPVMTQVITTVGCNQACNENSDCTNISHICYDGLCRLDVNPTDVNCRLPDGGNVIERPMIVPTESGFINWFNFFKAGLGILGLGALLLLLL